MVYLPADLANATSTARAEAAKNGYRASGADSNATIAVSQEPNPNRLRVKVTTTVPSYFVGLLGVDEITLTREAVAEYIAPVPMGGSAAPITEGRVRGTEIEFTANGVRYTATLGADGRLQGNAGTGGRFEAMKVQ